MEVALALPHEREPALYQPRQARKTPLYQLVEKHYEDVKAVWDDRFEKKFGKWRGFIDDVVWRYLDCGVEEAGFARLKCDSCGAEKLLTLSCKQRGICPSCDAKRAAAFAAFLKDELLENVGHCLWTFTLPKMLRPYFMYQRELLGDLARLGYETIKELMIEAVGNDKTRPGVVTVPQTFGNVLNPHPILSRFLSLLSLLTFPERKWVVSLPKMLVLVPVSSRALGEHARLAYETFGEVIAAPSTSLMHGPE